jgi:hypothetical protein
MVGAMIVESDLNRIRAIVREELARMLTKQLVTGTPEQRFIEQIRTILREELERIVDEQDRRLNEIFNIANEKSTTHE